MVVSLRVAVIYKSKPQFERIDLSTWSTVLLESLKRLGKRARIFIVALNVKASSR